MMFEPCNKNIQALAMAQHIQHISCWRCGDVLCGDGSVNTASLSWILVWYSTVYLVSQEQYPRGFLVLS